GPGRRVHGPRPARERCASGKTDGRYRLPAPGKGKRPHRVCDRRSGGVRPDDHFSGGGGPGRQGAHARRGGRGPDSAAVGALASARGPGGPLRRGVLPPSPLIKRGGRALLVICALRYICVRTRRKELLQPVVIWGT